MPANFMQLFLLFGADGLEGEVIVFGKQNFSHGIYFATSIILPIFEDLFKGFTQLMAAPLVLTLYFVRDFMPAVILPKG